MQGLLTIGSAVIASSVALYIATKVYPIQKDKDREIKIDEEKRLAYRDFLKEIDGLVNNRLFESREEQLRAVQKVKASLNEVLIFAGKETAEAMLGLYDAATILAGELAIEPATKTITPEMYSDEQKAANISFQFAVNAARRELGVEPLEVTVELDILTFVPDTE